MILKLADFFYTIIKGVRVILRPVSFYPNKRYEKKVRERLKNKDFSLLCHTCIGGCISHRLGLQFMSPTINLWMSDEDFLKFALNYKDYLNRDVVFVDEPGEKTPVGLLNDVKIHFNHYSSKEEALEKWNARKARINFDNVYIVAVLHDEDDPHLYDELSKAECKNYIILTSQKLPESKHIKYIKMSKFGLNKINYLDKDLMGFRKYEKTFDFVSFLNSEK